MKGSYGIFFGTLLTLLTLSPLFIKGENKGKTLVLSDTLRQKGIRKSYLGIFEDKKGQYTFGQVSSPLFADSFAFFQEDPVVKNSRSTYWLRFSLTNNASFGKKFLAEIFDHQINQIRFYAPGEDGKYHVMETGNLLPFFSRTFSHKNFEFDLPIPRGQTATFYMEVRSENESVMVPEIRSYNRFISYSLGEYYFLGIFYGILLMMTVHNLFVFKAIRKEAYLYYIFYVLNVSMYSLCKNGLAFHYLWPDHPRWNHYGSGVFLYCTVLFSILFTKRFLNLDENLPRFNIIINVIIGFRTIIFLASIAVDDEIFNAAYLDIIPLLMAFLSGVFCLLNGDRAARYFVFAYTLLFISFLITIMEQYGLIKSSIITVYSLNIGIVLDVVFLSISLADRMRAEIMMREMAQLKLVDEMKEKELLKDKVNKELEAKVTERTEQLKLANVKLQQQAEEITRMNLMLDLTNRDLQKNMTEIARTRVMKTHVDFDEFVIVYPDTLSCYRFLEELKTTQGFECKKCGSTSFGKGKEQFDRRCTRCGYNESVTANTIFHKLKFPIVKAFYMMYLVTTRKDITAEELSEIVDMRKATCSGFKKKIKDRMDKLNKKDLESWDLLVPDRAEYAEGQ